MLKSKSRWVVKEHNETDSTALQQKLNIPPIVSKLLANRGINDIEEAKAFLHGDEQPFHDPYLLMDMDKAVERVKKAIEYGEPILIFGDYDADGVSSTSTMMQTLLDLGAEAHFYIPNRFTEGYGPNENAFRWAAEEGFSLIITVDTGIAAVKEAVLAKELGMDLIITDHHEPGPELPEALAILHPKREGSTYPFADLAGVGVAFKFAHALYGEFPEHLLDLAAIGTIADLVPLKGENRAIAKKGLAKLRTSKRPGIAALCKAANTQMNDITEETVGFAIAPRINAIGRLGDADPAVDLMLSQDMEESMAIAQEIDGINKERQNIVNEMTQEAVEMVETEFPLSSNSVLVIGKEGWNSGVVGIVASRLVEKFYRPVIVLSFDSEKGQAKGSARSIAGFDLFKNLSQCRELLPHFGGHPMAAGMTLDLENVAELRNRLNGYANEQLTEEDFIPLTELDASIRLEEVDIETIESLQMLAPFGMGNPKPKLLIEGVTINGMRKIGGNQDHLKLSLQKDVYTLDSIGFGMGEFADHISPLAELSVIGELSVNEWNNIRKPQLFLKDLTVDHWQLFDMRGNKPFKRWFEKVPAHDRKIIAFSQATIDRLPLEAYSDDLVLLSSNEEAAELLQPSSSIVLLDLPPAAEWLETVVSRAEPERIYAHFDHVEDHFFSTVPKREHFKWYYGFLLKRGSFDLKKHGGQLAQHKGWSKETVEFMSKVFFELDFVTINNGLISVNSAKVKRDLEESVTYRQKQEQYNLENELLYSSYQELKDWFDKKTGMVCNI
ncbi:single-stranded-DNA-specific exonuclease RecJ [Rossellomorea vietnamensis]|uniref:Single-stranded-DNA-specific exonuclease RecJ n=1 Tax=Rossellomorea vietnamensis TaxID=218284 RepID=A0A5D4MHS1_9BACI|nr:single-stranded-DNA-specific exonuclease RecJ [Rossellomorea vietnamensis]TYS00874.1 single-stranded-DNA-specific exonuclease RecJ [Rossellomorea vietnamensis]